MPPSWQRVISGADQVRESWDIVFDHAPGRGHGRFRGAGARARRGRVGSSRASRRVNSDAGVGMLAATNVFEVQGDEWKIIHHHAHGLQGML